ncbi:MAG: TadE family protein [Actinomycetota bacterium]
MREKGSAAVDAVLSIVVLIFFSLGIIGVALALYGRNVLIASAHEGARAAMERGTDLSEAAEIARETVRRAAGGLIEDLEVTVAMREFQGRNRVRVLASARIRVLGPVRVPMSVTAAASGSREVTVP